MGTITVAILMVVATTPVAIPTGMTTYGLDIVVKFDAVRCLLWRGRSAPLTLSDAEIFIPEGGNIPYFYMFIIFKSIC